MLKQDELGQTLWNMVREKFPRKISSSFTLLHQGRKVNLFHFMWKQMMADQDADFLPCLIC